MSILLPLALTDALAVARSLTTGKMKMLRNNNGRQEL